MVTPILRLRILPGVPAGMVEVCTMNQSERFLLVFALGMLLFVVVRIATAASAPIRGDVDCSGQVTSRDALMALRQYAADYPYESGTSPCGGLIDTDCSAWLDPRNAFDMHDPLNILRYVAGLPRLDHPPDSPYPCSPIGEVVPS